MRCGGCAKKLREAARHWFNGGSRGSDTRADDLAAFGAPADVIEAVGRERQQEVFEVLPCNWPAVELFLAGCTQWRRSGSLGVVAGLDYPAVESAARMLGIEITPDSMRGLQIMEFEVLEEARRHERE